MRRLAKFTLILGVLAAVSSILWIVLLPTVVAAVIRSRTGFAVQVDKLSVNPFTANVLLSGLVMRNPADWPEVDFVDLRRFQADVELLPLLGRRLVANEIVVDVARLTLVRNKDGRLNAMAFKNDLTGTQDAGQPAAGSDKPPEFLIRHLVLRFDKLVYADHSGRNPAVKDYNLNLTRDLTNVDSLTKIISPFTGAALGVMSDAVGRLFKVRPDRLAQSVNVLQGAGKKTGETLKSIFQSLEKKEP